MIALLLVPIVLFLLYRWTVRNNKYFEKLKIPFVKPYPLFGALWPVFSRKSHPCDALTLGYDQFPKNRFSGYFEFHRPAILLHDPELVKQIAIKDHEQFPDHDTFCPVEVDPFVGRVIFFETGQTWKKSRKNQSPLFTSSKMSNMFVLVSEHVKAAVGRLVDDSKASSMVVEGYDLFSRMTNDVMTLVSLGIDVDSVHDRENDFYRNSLQITENVGFQQLKFFLLTVLPVRLFTLFRISILSDKCIKFYENAVDSVVNYRKKNNVTRPDFINSLMKHYKSEDSAEDQTQKEGYSNLDISAIAGTFLFAGIETSTAAVCFALYEMALNKQIREKLQAEVDAVHEELNGSPVTYDALQKMQYLDMVVSESLRKYPSVPMTNRASKKAYTIEDHNGKTFPIKQGQVVTIPIMSFHRDPRYFPNPDRFYPERFAEENSKLINKDAFMPFGVGPRMCIGLRLGLLETKCILYYLMVHFNVELNAKMERVRLKKSSTVLTAENGFWFNFIPRVRD
ncbi:cytochrome P450 9b2-like [Uranotaenia lowii]|uniref:cytochrome P450 9b2-like n=1 Tax=Uranotaenia lowii TaxID=190385 RepID=UPI002479294A|nr:cytochrome P450 9b2-like [Uranotaenia lowii]